MTDSKIGDILAHRYTWANQQQESLFADFARYRQLWKSKIVDPASYPWEYALFNPMVFAIIRSFVARVATGNVGVTLQAWNEQNRPKTLVNKQLLDWEFQEAQLFLRVARAMFSVGLYGKAFLATGWKFEKGKVIEETDADGQVVRKLTVSQTVNRADLDNLRVFDVFIANRNLPDLQKQPWIILQRWKTVAELEKVNETRGEEVYKRKLLAQIKDKKPFVRFVDYGEDVDHEEHKEAWKSGLLPILEMHDLEGRVVEMVRGESDLVLRDEDNPFYHGEYPLVDVTFFPEDDNFWSTGLTMPMEDLQMALNSVGNQYLTSARQQLNHMWITGDLRIPDWEFVNRPDGVIHVQGDINQIREVQHNDITNQALAMTNELKEQIQRTTGINDFLAFGAGSKNNDTLGGLQLEQNNLDQNLKLFLTMLEHVTITRLARQFLVLNQQYITSEQVIGITGRHGYKNLSIKPEDVSAEFTPIVIPNSTLPKNPIIRLQNLQNLKAMADKEQKVQVNTAPIWQEMVQLSGLTDLDEIVPSDRDEALEENELLKKGVEVECEVSDNHDVHIGVHQYELLAGELEPATTEAILAHIKQHQLWKMSADPNLLDSIQNPAAPASPVDPPGPLPNPNPAIDEGSLVDQLGQQLAQNDQPPAGLIDISPEATSA